MRLIFSLILAIGLSSCSVIRPGEAGVKQRFGKLASKVYTQGTIFYNPFSSRVIKTSIQTRNLELSINLPSKEGLSIISQISILYRIDKDKILILAEYYKTYNVLRPSLKENTKTSDKIDDKTLDIFINVKTNRIEKL